MVLIENFITAQLPGNLFAEPSAIEYNNGNINTVGLHINKLLAMHFLDQLATAADDMLVSFKQSVITASRPGASKLMKVVVGPKLPQVARGHLWVVLFTKTPTMAPVKTVLLFSPQDSMQKVVNRLVEFTIEELKCDEGNFAFCTQTLEL